LPPDRRFATLLSAMDNGDVTTIMEALFDIRRGVYRILEFFEEDDGEAEEEADD
jgi:hypothetical protein